MASRVTQIARKVWATVTSPTARVTQVARKVWVTVAAPSARVTQVVRKVWITPDTTEQVTQVEIGVIYDLNAEGAATQMSTDSIYQVDEALGAVTQMSTDSLYAVGVVDGLVTQVSIDAIVDNLAAARQSVVWR